MGKRGVRPIGRTAARQAANASSILARSTMGRSSNGKILPSQGRDRGSIPRRSTNGRVHGDALFVCSERLTARLRPRPPLPLFVRRRTRWYRVRAEAASASGSTRLSSQGLAWFCTPCGRAQYPREAPRGRHLLVGRSGKGYERAESRPRAMRPWPRGKAPGFHPGFSRVRIT